MPRTLFADIRTRRFARSATKEALAAFGLLSAIAGVISALFPNLLSKSPGLWISLAVVLCAAWGLARAWPRPIERQYDRPDTTIRVVRGDLLEQPGHLVIGTCDTFDTQTPSIIATSSLQGQALSKFYGGDFTRLDAELASALSEYTSTGPVAKAGKTDRYPLGTVAVLNNNDRKLFWVAYTEMDQHNQASSSTDGVWSSLTGLWSAAHRHGNGGQISIPVIGGGQSRLSPVLPAQDSIRLIALSFMFSSRVARVCDELQIVVRPEDYERLDRLEFQAFLDSLAPS